MARFRRLTIGRSRSVTRLVAAALTLTFVAVANADGVGATTDIPDSTEVPDRTESGGTSDAPGTAGASDLVAALEPQPLAEAATIKVSMPIPIESFTHLLLAQELGEFERENLTVEIISLPSADVIPSLASGEIDFALTSLGAGLLNAVDQGFDVEMVAPLYYGPGGSEDGLFVRNDLVDGAPANLEGTRHGSIAGLTGSPVLPIGDYLAEGGVSVADLTPEQLPQEGLVAALREGTIESAWISSPLPPGTEEVATRVAQFADGDTPAGVMASPQIRENTEVTEAFLRALARTVNTYLQGAYFTNPEVVTAMAAATGSPEDSFVTGRELVWSPTLALPTAEAVDRYQGYLAELPDLLAYDELIPYEELVDASFLENLGLG